MVHGEEHIPTSSTPTRSSEHNCRRGVQNMVRQVRMDIPENQPFPGTIVHRPICKQTVISTPSICELEARSSDAFTQDWNTLPEKLYANPLWGLIGRVLSLLQTQGVQELVTIQPVCQNNLPNIIHVPQLAVWVISTNNVKAATFLRQQQTSGMVDNLTQITCM